MELMLDVITDCLKWALVVIKPHPRDSHHRSNTRVRTSCEAIVANLGHAVVNTEAIVSASIICALLSRMQMHATSSQMCSNKNEIRKRGVRHIDPVPRGCNFLLSLRAIECFSEEDSLLGL